MSFVTISLYLQHIMEALDKIASFLQGIERDQFLASDLIQAAVIRELQVAGEAAKRITPEFQQTTPDIPWYEVTGTRDKLVHGYFDVDFEQVWLTCRDDLPPLKQALGRILDKK